MTVPGNIDALLLGGQRGYQIERSLRFNSADSAYLNRTPASAGNQKTWTWSGWVKKSGIAQAQTLFARYTASNDAGFLGLYFNSTETLNFTGWNTVYRTTSALYRDASAWYHVVLSVDTTQATAANRIKLYVNGSEVTAFSTSNNPTQNDDLVINAAAAHEIGRYASSNYFSGYLTEVHLIDGQALTPSSFGETDTITGVWKPKKYSGTYGTNGFYLKFADNSGTTSTTLGKDSSGNSNNWTPNNFSVTAGSGNDSLIDTPTLYADGGNGRGNYCTLNAVSPLASGTLSNGNLSFSTGNADAIAVGTVAVSSGKWYWEITATNVNASLAAIGIIGQPPASLTVDLRTPSNGYCYISNGNKGNNNTTAAYGATYTSGDVIGVAFDLDAGTLVFYKNNSSQGTAYSSLSGTFSPAISDLSGASGGAVFDCNFGQRAFAYTPPSGFLALNTQNLPEPSIKKPSSYMDAKLYTGNNGTLTVTGLGFSPDLVWIKNREVAGTGNAIQDTVRGATAYLISNSTNAENTNTANNWFRAFTSDGFTVAATTSGGTPTSEWNNNGSGYVAWCWDESATPGFDIVTYTGDGTTSANRLIDHSLGVQPDFVITKKRSGGTDYGWSCWHKDLGGNYGIFLNSTNARNPGMWAGYSNFSSTKFTPPDLLYGNENGATYVNYLWSEVAGFSKFGSYTGNGSSDGPFVFCGFRPRWVMVKCSNEGALNWLIFDALRPGFNVVSQTLLANDSTSEVSGITAVDFTSNGFKLRDDNINRNKSGNTYIFAAFAESPFKYSLAR